MGASYCRNLYSNWRPAHLYQCKLGICYTKSLSSAAQSYLGVWHPYKVRALMCALWCSTTDPTAPAHCAGGATPAHLSGSSYYHTLCPGWSH